ncbi:MAG TPA: hemolysin family protein [Blastocatellia bacterium]|nr:hemolysin family protein [Blastocatellia bacterium]
MTTVLGMICVAIAVLVFLSTIESAYESLTEVTLRVMLSEHEGAARGRFFAELLEHRLLFELTLVFGTQSSIVLVAILLFDLTGLAAFPYPLTGTFCAALGIVIVFRQLLPRLIAQNQPEKVFWRLLPFFRVFYGVTYFVVLPVSRLLSRMKRPEPEEVSSEQQDEEAKEEIQAFIDVGEEQGILEESEGELIQSIVEFSDTMVGDVMRPRPHVVAIESKATMADARRLIIESKYSRIPVYTEQMDNIEGVVYVRDLLAFCEGDQLLLPVTKCMRPAYFVPETKPIATLLEEMQKAKVQMAIVIDEYGGVAGLVTVEDIIEEIVGEIEDEDRSAAQPDIVPADDGSYSVSGAAEIKQVELLFEKEIESDDFTTVAGLIINELGHVPDVGEKLQFKGLEFEVAEADSRRVKRVRLRPLTEPAEKSEAVEGNTPGI